MCKIPPSNRQAFVYSSFYTALITWGLDGQLKGLGYSSTVCHRAPAVAWLLMEVEQLKSLLQHEAPVIDMIIKPRRNSPK